ncbi:MAG: hypothetical protein AAFQ94_15875 [Bacteroidota bacterium]
MLKQFDQDSARLTYMFELIKKQATGNRQQFAAKLQVSVSQLSNYLTYLKTNGVRVLYDHSRKCYYLDDENQIVFTCGFRVVKNDN